MTPLKIMMHIRTSQQPIGESAEKLELQTEGTMTRYPDHIDFSYAETAVTDMEGVTTTFSVYGDRIVMTRDGEKLKNTMEFRIGESHDSLYDVGFGALLMTVSARDLTIDLAHGFFEVEYAVDIEHTPAGTNRYRVDFKPI